MIRDFLNGLSVKAVTRLMIVCALGLAMGVGGWLASFLLPPPLIVPEYYDEARTKLEAEKTFDPHPFTLEQTRFLMWDLYFELKEVRGYVRKVAGIWLLAFSAPFVFLFLMRISKPDDPPARR